MRNLKPVFAATFLLLAATAWGQRAPATEEYVVQKGDSLSVIAKRFGLDYRKLAEWNRPVWWPMVLLGVALLTLVAVGWRSLKRRERTNARGEVLA